MHRYLAQNESTHIPKRLEEPSKAQYSDTHLESHQRQYVEIPANIEFEEDMRKRTSSVDQSTRFAKRQKSENFEISQDIAEVQGLVDYNKKENDCTKAQLTTLFQDKPAPPLPMQEGFAVSSRSSPNSSAKYRGVQDGQAV